MEYVEPENPQTRGQTIAYRALDADSERYQQLEMILDELPDTAPDSAKCDNFMPDLAYGILRLTRNATTAEISWNSGCQDRIYAPFLKVLRDADTLVSGWAKDIPVTRTESQRR